MNISDNNGNDMVTLSIEATYSFVRLLLDLSDATHMTPGKVIRNAMVLYELAVEATNNGDSIMLGDTKVTL